MYDVKKVLRIHVHACALHVKQRKGFDVHAHTECVVLMCVTQIIQGRTNATRFIGFRLKYTNNEIKSKKGIQTILITIRSLFRYQITVEE